MANEVNGILEETVTEEAESLKDRRKRKRSERLKLFTLPVTIAVVSTAVSGFLGYMQLESANRIANAQINSAREIADAQRETTEKIAKNNLRRQAEVAAAETKLERLSQIKDVFQGIIKPRKGEQDALVSEIASLVVYEDTALPFLLRIKEHFSTKPVEFGRTRRFQQLSTLNAQSGSEREMLAAVADKTIREILSLSQLDLSGMKFNPRGNGRTLLRFARFSGYNLTEADFSNTNLFNANFTKSTLVGAKFNNTDLQSANFTDANLSGAEFGSGTNLTKTNFEKTKIDGVKFDTGVICIEEAKFSMGALLKVGKTPKGEKEPFEDLDPEKYLRLLAPHRETIVEMANDPKIEGIKAKLRLSIKELVYKLKEVNAKKLKCRA